MDIFDYLKYIAVVGAVIAIFAVRYFIAPHDAAEAQMIDEVIERIVQEESGVDISPLFNSTASATPATNIIPTTNAL
jgi:hypothetical protein